MSGKHLMSDFKIEAAKAAPAVGGAVFATVSDNVNTVAATTLTWSEIAAIAEYANQELENIGARRLYTVLEKILADLSFAAPDSSGSTVIINKDYVAANLGDTLQSKDLSRYIL